ncbi:MAG: VanZ family protein [Lachnospiraceae bacterium]|nr:VanZ family protein [Lachnospiraceae bacterium]
MNKFFLKMVKWIPATLIFAVSWHLSSLEKIECMPSFRFADKVVHGICFAGLAFWVAFACGTNRMKKIPLPIAITSIYGIIDEFHQRFTPGRESSVFDWAADTVGAAFGSICFVLIFCAIERILAKRRKYESPKN